MHKFRGNAKHKNNYSLAEYARVSFEKEVEFELDIKWGQELAKEGKVQMCENLWYREPAGWVQEMTDKPKSRNTNLSWWEWVCAGNWWSLGAGGEHTWVSFGTMSYGKSQLLFERESDEMKMEFA